MITTRTSTVPALVLIVEDDPPIADLIAAVVEGAGYEPLVATHGRQGLDLARLRQPGGPPPPARPWPGPGAPPRPWC